MIKTEEKPCPKCGGEIILMGELLRNPQIYAECQKCKTEYDLPKVKLRAWPSNLTRISKTTIREAQKAWDALYRLIKEGSEGHA